MTEKFSKEAIEKVQEALKEDCATIINENAEKLLDALIDSFRLGDEPEEKLRINFSVLLNNRTTTIKTKFTWATSHSVSDEYEPQQIELDPTMWDSHPEALYDKYSKAPKQQPEGEADE